MVMKDDQSLHGSYSCIEVGSSTLCQYQHDDFIAMGCNSTTNSMKKLYARQRDLKLCRWETDTYSSRRLYKGKNIAGCRREEKSQKYKRFNEI
jgi:hypothetical protein